MNTDLEQEVRRAMRRRAATVTPDRLRHDRPRADRVAARSTRRGPSWTWMAPAATVVGVLIVVAVVIVSRGGSGGRPAVGTHRAASMTLVGTDWRLIEVRYPDGRKVAVPERVGADVAFERDGARLGGSDGVNAYTASYSVRANGDLLIGSLGETQAGYAGRDPARLAAIDGLDNVLGSQNVSVDVDGQRLRLSDGDFTLTFAFAAPLATSSEPRPAEPS